MAGRRANREIVVHAVRQAGEQVIAVRIRDRQPLRDVVGVSDGCVGRLEHFGHRSGHARLAGILNSVGVQVVPHPARHAGRHQSRIPAGVRLPAGQAEQGRRAAGIDVAVLVVVRPGVLRRPGAPGLGFEDQVVTRGRRQAAEPVMPRGIRRRLPHEDIVRIADGRVRRVVQRDQPVCDARLPGVQHAIAVEVEPHLIADLGAAVLRQHRDREHLVEPPPVQVRGPQTDAVRALGGGVEGRRRPQLVARHRVRSVVVRAAAGRQAVSDRFARIGVGRRQPTDERSAGLVLDDRVPVHDDVRRAARVLELGNKVIPAARAGQVEHAGLGIEVDRPGKLARGIDVPAGVRRDRVGLTGYRRARRAGPQEVAGVVQLRDELLIAAGRVRQRKRCGAWVEVGGGGREGSGRVRRPAAVDRNAFARVRVGPAPRLRPDVGARAVQLGNEGIIDPGAGQIRRACARIKIYRTSESPRGVDVPAAVDGDAVAGIIARGPPKRLCPGVGARAV